MGQNNKRANGGGPVVMTNGAVHHNNISTNSFGDQPHGGPLNLEPNSQSNMIYSSDSGKVTLDDFELLKVIGQGNFAKVMQVKKKDTQKIYAMKILNKKRLEESDQLEHIKTERAVLQYVEHPFLVRLVYAFQSTEKLYMVMDFINGGELFFHLKKLKRFPEDLVKLYAAELFLSLDHLHKHNVVFRDLKPENVLMDKDGHVMLTDFGLAKFLSNQDRTHTFCGTPEYLAPEVLLQKGHGKPVDWWSYGTLIYEMLVGIPPFYCENVQEMYDRILNGELVLPDEFISLECQDLLARLLERDPRRRLGSGPTASEEIRNHPWFSDLNWEDVYFRRYKPRYKPNVKNEEDTSYFDDEFTKQMPVDSVSATGVLDDKLQREFEGFTYTEGGYMGDDNNDKVMNY